MRSAIHFLIAALAVTGVSRADEKLVALADTETRENSGQLAALTDSGPDAESDRSHWLRGEVRIGDEWIHFSQVSNLDSRQALRERYRELRSDRGSSVDDQLNLADECRKLNLVDEERAHLEQVVRQVGNHAAARERLGDLLIEGSWYSPRDRQQLRTRLTDLASAEKRYGAVIRKAVKQLNDPLRRRQEAAGKILAAIQDPAAIPLMEQALAYGNEESQFLYLNWLDHVPSWKSSAAMAKLSLTSESPRVRVEIARRLRERPWEEFVPVYMSELTAPTAYSVEFVRNAAFVQLTLVSTTETHEAIRTNVAISRCVARDIVERISIRSKKVWYTVPTSAQLQIEAAAGVLQVVALRESVENSSRNAQQALRNGHACRELSACLEIQGSNSPSDWWDWWNAEQGYTDVEKQRLFATYEGNWYVDRRGKPRQGSPRMRRIVKSCFVPGTLIQTESGLSPIESIQIGDRVLSQDVETGELAYKPVLRTTVRESKDTRRIRVGSDELQCSPGHPFWVNGQGWVQAQDLMDESQFHTTKGAAAVTSISEDLGTTVHNLEVADFNTYFVGNSHILSHDVTVRDPSDMVEPGVLKPELAAFAAKSH